ncbi:hypothetical protein yrohd0001_27540 [Yersinia rohdei ATCC 43380]|nr:hypothetical protein yrohd0001_27540 [Yersinia rohdei ATCC 43380]
MNLLKFISVAQQTRQYPLCLRDESALFIKNGNEFLFSISFPAAYRL